MAILSAPTDPTGAKIEVEILVNDKAAQEHVDEADENPPNTVTKYIESVSGEEFAVRATVTGSLPNAILLDVHLDGKWARGTFINQSDCSHGRSHAVILKGSTSNVKGQWYNQNFCFAALETDDSEDRPVSETVKNVIKGIGEISVRCVHVKNLRLISNPASASLRDTSGLGTVPEKALKGKALSHQTSFRAPEATGNVRIYHYDFIDPSKQPFLTCNFRYRSRESLRAECIVARTPSPVPLEERNVEDLTMEEMRELLRRQREQSQRAVEVKPERVKRERSDESDRTLVEDDDEVSFVQSKRVKGPMMPMTLNEDGVEIFDLT